MAKGITGTGQGFDLPGRCLGGFSRQPPLSSLRPSALAATENRARRDDLLPSDVQVVAAILRLHLAQHKLLPWLLKGDYTMTCGTSPSPQTASLLLRNCWTSCRLKYLHEFEGISAQTSPVTSMSGQESIGDHPTWQCNTCTLLNQV
ncbi:ZINC ION BINDING PROTEIN [Salix purpurea]|uniref:ZINC ION BINDING PROTEIN n=1 Tax=Salix purpurea TaxID=77065 RepID=A0A9Q0TT65_SALPP|nr:ZINC ION BINDING PROTEIN [Salix purpurea]